MKTRYWISPRRCADCRDPAHRSSSCRCHSMTPCGGVPTSCWPSVVWGGAPPWIWRQVCAGQSNTSDDRFAQVRNPSHLFQPVIQRLWADAQCQGSLLLVACIVIKSGHDQCVLRLCQGGADWNLQMPLLQLRRDQTARTVERLDVYFMICQYVSARDCVFQFANIAGPVIGFQRFYG